MKKVTAYQADDGTLHLTEKEAAIAEFKAKHAGVFGEDALAMMLHPDRSRELGELLTVIGREEIKVPAPRVRRPAPVPVVTAPAKDTKARKRPQPGARVSRTGSDIRKEAAA